MHASVLAPEQIQRLHEASLEILDSVGVLVPHPEVLSRLADHGAAVNRAAKLVRFPPDVTTKLLAIAGRGFTLFGRDLSRRAAFGQGSRNYNSIAGEAFFADSPGGPRRAASLQDVETAVRFADALDEINMPGAMADPQELSAASRCVRVLAAMLANTTKPVHFWFHDRASARFIVEMLIALRGGEEAARTYPLCTPFLEPISPLRFPFNGIDLLFETSRLNLPVPVGPMAQMGLSAPATIAGTIAQENAEVLAGIAITQVICPRLPVCYGGICHAFDMRTTQLVFGGPEQAIFGVAMTQMGKSYGLPVYINVGLTDSKLPDAQAGMETGVTLALGAAAGADIFGHMGIAGVDQASSLDMLVLQAEAISYVESTLREIDLSDEALGLDVIREAGPGGTFIDRQHTVDHFRRELWFPRLLDREYYEPWLKSGARGTEERCRVRKEEILAVHQPDPMPEDLKREIDAVARSAERLLSAH